MRIRRIQLYRFRGFDDLQLIFPPKENLTVFIGQNGSGKTSLLDGISMILQDSLYKHHHYDKVEWNNPFNVQNPHLYGSIALELQGPKRSYKFSQSLSASRIRFISEDKLALERNRDLTDEEKMEHFKAQGRMAFDEKLYGKALEEYFKLASLQEFYFGKDNIEMADTLMQIGESYFGVNDYDKSINYLKMALSLQEKILAPNDKKIVDSCFNISFCYMQLEKPKLTIKYLSRSIEIYQTLAIDNSDLGIMWYCNGWAHRDLGDSKNELFSYQKAISILEDKGDDDTLFDIYNDIIKMYEKLGDIKMVNFYNKKVKTSGYNKAKDNNKASELFLNIDEDSLRNFNEYLEVRIPLILYYSSHHTNIEIYKDALSMAFRIPMTTDFDMISDWFIEYENEENRKRLRVDTEYRSVELETIREVITKGLSLLNNESGNHFTELQTEIDETVKDGQVASWLSIKKDGKRLNVKQLSDGEKRVLILLIDITRRLITVGKTNNETDFFNGFGIILIDEIEQHLHPKWQRMLLPTLNKLFPNLQFVVTTHSPQVLSYVPNGCAYSLEEGKAFPENTYGKNNEWILEAIMDDVSRPVEVKKQLDKYFDAIRDNEMDKALKLREELETQIGADEPELLKADILIRRKLKSVVKNEDNS